MKSRKFLLFIFNPFLSAIDSLLNIKKRDSRILLYFWFLVFGMCLCAVNKEADSFRYYNDFIRDSKLTWNDYVAYITDYFSFQSAIKDIYTISVHYLVSRFTTNYHWVFLFYSAIFGFFYIKTVSFFAKSTINNRTVFLILLLFLCFSNPIFNINGVRFWTAAWIAVYSLLKISYDKKYQYAILLLITPLIHASYFLVLVLLLLYLISRFFVKGWMVIFVLSIFVSAMSYLELFDSVLQFFPDFLQGMMASYSENSERIASLEGAGEPLYARVLNALPNYYVLLLACILIIKKKSICVDANWERLFVMYLIIASFSNFTMSIPSTGGRYIQLSFPFLAILWLKSYENLKQYNSIIIYGIPICFAYSVLHWFRNVMSVTELDLYLFPLPIQIIKYLFL